MFVQIRVIEVFSAVSAAVSPCPGPEVKSNEKDQLDGWTQLIAYAYWNFFYFIIMEPIFSPAWPL